MSHRTRVLLLLVALATAAVAFTPTIALPSAATSGPTVFYNYDSPAATTTLGTDTRGDAAASETPTIGGLWSSTSSISSSLAARGGAAVVRGGETAATAYGRSIHKAWDYGSGFRKEVRLANGRRADAVNFRAREVVELKPNNPAAIARGNRQAAAYAEQLTKEYPGTPFTWRVQTYDRP